MTNVEKLRYFFLYLTIFPDALINKIDRVFVRKLAYIVVYALICLTLSFVNFLLKFIFIYTNFLGGMTSSGGVSCGGGVTNHGGVARGGVSYNGCVAWSEGVSRLMLSLFSMLI